MASQEYRALGIATALSPQVDLATEPRWSRFMGTFGEGVELDTDMARAYCDGFQTSYGDREIRDGWGYDSVNAMVKHWPGGASGEGGRDAHYAYGKYAVYPGKNLETDVYKRQPSTTLDKAIFRNPPIIIKPRGECVKRQTDKNAVAPRFLTF